jgi:hypothetical protein
MNLDEALRRYRANQFSDEDVTLCTDLSERKWRELIKDKMVRTVMHSPGRGRIRLCDATTLKRAAVIAALNRAGLSLAVSSGVAFFLPFHTALYEVCDPIFLRRTGAGELRTKVHWFDPNRPAQAEPESDWRVEIYDGRFVGATYGPKQTPVIFGDLRDAATRFVAWLPLHRIDQFVGCAIEKLAIETGREKLGEAVAAWEEPTKWTRELNSLGYSFERHDDDDPPRATAAATVNSSLFTMTVNVSLAIRRALRRYLGIEPPGRGSQ